MEEVKRPRIEVDPELLTAFVARAGEAILQHDVARPRRAHAAAGRRITEVDDDEVRRPRPGDQLRVLGLVQPPVAAQLAYGGQQTVVERAQLLVDWLLRPAIDEDRDVLAATLELTVVVQAPAGNRRHHHRRGPM